MIGQGMIGHIRLDGYIRTRLERDLSEESSRRRGPRGGPGPFLAGLGPALGGGTPLLFEVGSVDDLFRTLSFRDELPVTPWVRRSGYEYQVLDVLEDLDEPLILQLAGGLTTAHVLYGSANPIGGQNATVLGVLDGNLLIHAHGYRADEIPMLMKLADDFGLKIQVFIHAVEGGTPATLLTTWRSGRSPFS